MGKALVIPDCSFVHTIGQVTFMDVHCTSISLDVDTLTIPETGTATILPVVTPENTTDVIVWTSSDDTVASVASGIVTANAEGTATITATCGNYSASCVVTVTTNKAFVKGGNMFSVLVASHTLQEYAILAAAVSGRGIGFGSSTGTYKVLATTTDIEKDNGYENIYPYPIPNGSTKIHVTCPGIAPIIVYYNSQVKGTGGGAQISNLDFPKVLDGETPVSGTDWSISAWTKNQRTFDIPSIDGIDSFTLGFYADTQNAYDNFDPSTVQITFE